MYPNLATMANRRPRGAITNPVTGPAIQATTPVSSTPGAGPVPTPAPASPPAQTKYNPLLSYKDANIFLQGSTGGVSMNGNDPMYENQDAVNKFMQENGYGSMEYDNGGNPYTITTNTSGKPMFKDPKAQQFFSKYTPAAVERNPDGSPNTSGLYNSKAVFYDPNFGWVTASNNIKGRVEETKLGKVMSTAMPLVMGAMMGGIGGLPALTYGLGMGGMKMASGQGSWKSLIPTLAGAALGYAGVPGNLAGLAKTGVGLALNNPFARRKR